MVGLPSSSEKWLWTWRWTQRGVVATDVLPRLPAARDGEAPQPAADRVAFYCPPASTRAPLARDRAIGEKDAPWIDVAPPRAARRRPLVGADSHPCCWRSSPRPRRPSAAPAAPAAPSTPRAGGSGAATRNSRRSGASTRRTTRAGPTHASAGSTV